ncbi:MAG: right-handed parallel beta-helix repeat-containing protein [Kiritimatiellae bacterium]|nr:right-handed parallel beta-helix repeat-containing protein [Kiritimatiellia bacterium]
MTNFRTTAVLLAVSIGLHCGRASRADPAGDPDGDGYLNAYEEAHGSDTNNPRSVPAATLYVDALAAPGGDGSPGAPFDTVQAALDAAVDYDIVRLADGLYRGAGNKDLDFLGKPVMVFSAGGAPACVLDCEGSGSGANFISGESRLSLLAGVTVCHANSGAVYCASSSPTLRDCTLAENTANNGGGLFCLAADPALAGCTILSNAANNGGGICCFSSNPALRDCLILANAVTTDGGGLWLDGSSPDLAGCVLIGNTAEYGAGLYAVQASAPVLRNCTVVRNRADYGGGALYSSPSSSGSIRNGVMWANEPTQIEGGSVTAAWSCIAGGFAGAGNIDSDPQLVGGPAAYRLKPASPCIDAGDAGEAPASDIDGEARWDDPGRTNVISAADMGADEFVDSDQDGMADVWESTWFTNLVRTGEGDADLDGLADGAEYGYGTNPADPDSDGDALSDGAEVLTYGTDPHLADSDADGLADGAEVATHRTDPALADTDGDGLADGAELFVHGTAPRLADTDGDGLPDGLEVALGFGPTDPADPANGGDDPDGDGYLNVYEWVHGTDPQQSNSIPAPTLYVNAASPAGGDGSHAAPFQAVQDALDAAAAYAVVQVAAGVYTGSRNRNLDVRGKPLVLYAAAGPAGTIVDCQGAGRGFVFSSGESPRTVIRGFTVRNGYAEDGGGIRCESAHPTLDTCVLTANTAEDLGGALLCLSASPRILNCRIAGNTAEEGGGGLYCHESADPLISNCVFEANAVEAVQCWAARPVLRDCVLIRNTGRGLLCLSGSDLVAENCVVARNVGGGVHCVGSSPVLRNCTVADNLSGWVGGIFCYGSNATPVVANGIVWGNSPRQIAGEAGGAAVVSFSCVQNGYAGLMNILADPLLIRGPAAYRLQAGSPCIDAGTFAGAPLCDIEREPRWDDPAHAGATSIVDMGADEFVDTDADGMGDAWERREFGSLARDGSADADGDGLSDLAEYESGTVPGSADPDADGLGDAAEIGVYGTDPNDADTDDDGMPDGWETAHALDPLDGGLGDPLQGAAGDPDADRLANIDEYRNGTSPHNPDSDADGLGDGAEVFDYGCDPTEADTDSDGWTDGEEVGRGHSPTDALAHPPAVRYDFDGDHVSDIWFYDAPSGTWFIRLSRSGGARVLPFGWNGPAPVPGDYDGDGVADPALYDRPSGMWYLLQSSAGFRAQPFGWAGAAPVPGDYDADYATDLGVYQADAGSWFLLRSRAGFAARQFGWPGPAPVPADYDGDAQTDLAVYDAAAGNWYRWMSRDGFAVRQFGWLAPAPVPADYDGDGRADIALYHQAAGAWYILQSSAGFRFRAFGWDQARPVPADYDGDGRTDLAVRAPGGMWYVLRSSDGRVQVVHFGW